MLRENGIYDVKVTSVHGFLSDHYNPANKTVNLSPDVYNGISLPPPPLLPTNAAMPFSMLLPISGLTMRSKLVPAVQVSSILVNWVLLIGGNNGLLSGNNPTVLLVGIIVDGCYRAIYPDYPSGEFDASKRALAWLNHTNVTTSDEYPKAKDALKWAATTYVVAALAAVVTLVQYIYVVFGKPEIGIKILGKL